MSKKMTRGDNEISVQYFLDVNWRIGQKAERRCESNLKQRSKAERSPPKYGGYQTPEPSGRKGRKEKMPSCRMSVL